MIKRSPNQDQVLKIDESIPEASKYIVGIGSSAGGLEAINSFFEKVPKDSGLSFVLIQHLSRDYKSKMPELLAKHTELKIDMVINPTVVQPNYIYTVPTDKNITISKGILYLEDRDDSKTLNLPINIFFKSLAEDQKARAIGVILSGTGSDGTLGIKSIKENGGMVIAQDFQTAAFDSMPKNAIGTGLVDFILHPAQMPETIVQYVKHPFVKHHFDENDVSKGDEINQILVILHQKTNMDFRLYKKTTVVRRIERRMSVRNILSCELYLKYLMNNPEEIDLLGNEILIGVTGFFRDSKAFDTLDKEILARLVRQKQIRIWVAGCSTGQEVYSIAILLKEHFHSLKKEIPTKIFATDIDQRAIDKARKGVYTETVQEEVSEHLLNRYFTKSDDTYTVLKELREMVIFARHDISKDPPFNNIDLVLCRNLLIYIEPSLQEKILSFIHISLNENGYLFLGTSESLGTFARFFDETHKKYKIYKNKAINRTVDIHNLYPFEHRKKEVASKEHPGDHQLRTLSESKIISNFKDTMLEDLVPPTVIINENLDVVHVAGEINKFVQLPKKQLTLNLLKMIDEQLYVPVSNIISRVKSQKKRIFSAPINFENGTVTLIKIIAKLYTEPVGKHNYIILSFIEATTKVKSSGRTTKEIDLTKERNLHIRRLEDELKETKEYLRSTIEELETSYEDLQATNEELIAANEELQSGNEELQSVNEELYTVNSEFQDKLEEMTELNDDLNNFLQSTHIATLFLDIDLSVKRFTDAVKPLINITKNDIGRYIGDFNHTFSDFDLITTAQMVLDNFNPIEKEVSTKGGHIYLMRILPYMTSKREVWGVVFVFVDVNELKKIEQQLKSKADELEINNSDLKQFAFLAAHDLKSPIINIESLLMYLDEGNYIKQNGLPIFRRLRDTVDRMNRTIVILNEVISIKKNLDIDSEEIKFDAALQNVFSIISEQISSSNAIIHTDFKRVPKMFFPLVHLENIFQNLIENSIKYKSNDRNPIIYISTKSENGAIVLIISDNGRGIDLNSYGKKIFRLFQRFHLDVEGKGIGLHIIKTMIERYHGRIEVESYPEVGTTFKIFFAPESNSV
ncbi:CheR family methyltransferase [Reichenbachiella sp. MALMAid0571]|uniref:CheR family methyltransferase n=1 Tax=Reichenbachiella sp. MALMAid0571 TaxID=3143939 RepID=UPI0032DEA472